MAADFVGHHKNGYLNPTHDHPLELQVDAYFIQSSSPCNASQWRPLLPIPAASALVNRSDPSSCSSGGVEAAFDKFQALLVAERAALPLMRDVLGHMASFDVCGAADPAAALRHLDLSRAWINAACQYWFDAVPALMNQTLHPDGVDALISSYVETLFVAHNGTVC